MDLFFCLKVIWYVLFLLLCCFLMTFLECEESGVRIDKWLVSKFSYSRNFFHHIIER